MKTTITKSQLIEMYNETLNELHEPMFGILPSNILEECDSTQYYCGLNDYYDSLTHDDYYCEEMQ
jgi:hypothetical protein